MPAESPTIEGFRAAFRRPSLTFAEIAWRWTVGATAAALLFFYFIEYVDTLPVSRADSLLLSTRQPAFVGKAIAHLLRGSLNRAVLAALIAAIALSVLWVLAGSIGRLATVRALVDYFRKDAFDHDSSPEDSRPLRALIHLNFLRAAVILAMILALAGAAILSSFVSTDKQPRPGLVFSSFVLFAGLICSAAWSLNWWLSLAEIFAVRDGEDALVALSAGVVEFRERLGSFLAVSTWTGLAHLVAFSIATTAVSLPLAFLRIAPTRLVIAVIFVFMLAYFAVADWLYIARLAGYVYIVETPEASLSRSADPTPQGNISPLETSIDRSEPILSDLPNLALES